MIKFDKWNIEAYNKKYHTDVLLYNQNLKLTVYHGQLDEQFLDMFRFCLDDLYAEEKLEWIILKNVDDGENVRLVQVAINDKGEKLLKVDLKMEKKRILAKSNSGGSNNAFWWGILAGISGASLFETFVGLVLLDAVQRKKNDD
jgi:hypothetical protein